MTSLADVVEQAAAETGFSGVVRVDDDGQVVLERAFGLADRAHAVPVRVGTRFGVASGAKPFTALTVMRLVEDGVLGRDTRARDLLGADLPLIDDAVTVEQLLAHRSGIGDYFDEELFPDPGDFFLDVPVHTLTTAASYLPVLGGHEQKFPPGSDFAYCNGGYLVLALLAERAAGVPFHDLVETHVIERAGLTHTAYLRSDELPGDAALGYLSPDGLRSNVLQLPVVGGGDGGIWTNSADVAALWAALDAGRVVSASTRDEMWRVRSTTADGDSYGLGFWLGGSTAYIVGSDAGASFHTGHLPGGATTMVLCNVTDLAWPMVKRLEEALGGSASPA